MSVEAIGDIMTGGLTARAVEPRAGEDPGHSHETHCLNCAAPLQGRYCHKCGQESHVHRTLGAFGHDLLHGVLHLEGKTWRTLPMLTWRPGELTRRYIAGERARFVSPLALFLFTVFLMFAVFNALGPSMSPTGFSNGLEDDIVGAEQRLAGFAMMRSQRAAQGRDTAALDAQLRAGHEQVRQLRALAGSPVFQRSGSGVGEGVPKWLGKPLAKFLENPGLVTYKLQTNAYKYSWALIPIFLPFVWLLFLHRERYRRYRAYDHVVFITYSLCAQMMLMMLYGLAIAAGMPSGVAGWAVGLLVSAHVYIQFRGAYELGRFSSFWRMIALTLAASISLILFLAAILALGLVG